MLNVSFVEASAMSVVGQKVPVEVAMQFEYLRLPLSPSNDRYSASKLNPTLPQAGP
jgi:hypothetical protein